jgi:hypothetical protein
VAQTLVSAGPTLMSGLSSGAKSVEMSLDAADTSSHASWRRTTKDENRWGAAYPGSSAPMGRWLANTVVEF